MSNYDLQTFVAMKIIAPFKRALCLWPFFPVSTEWGIQKKTGDGCFPKVESFNSTVTWLCSTIMKHCGYKFRCLSSFHCTTMSISVLMPNFYIRTSRSTVFPVSWHLRYCWFSCITNTELRIYFTGMKKSISYVMPEGKKWHWTIFCVLYYGEYNFIVWNENELRGRNKPYRIEWVDDLLNVVTNVIIINLWIKMSRLRACQKIWDNITRRVNNFSSLTYKSASNQQWDHQNAQCFSLLQFETCRKKHLSTYPFIQLTTWYIVFNELALFLRLSRFIFNLYLLRNK